MCIYCCNTIFMVFYILDSIRITVFTNFLSDNIHFSRVFWPENTPRASIRVRASIGMNTVSTCPSTRVEICHFILHGPILFYLYMAFLIAMF